MNQSCIYITAMVILIWAAESALAERVYKVDKVFSGSAAPIALDLNDDGFPAIRAIGSGPGFSMNYPFRPTFQSTRNPSEGAFRADLVSEAVPVEEPTGRCPADEIELESILYSSVHLYWNGDLLVSELIEGYSCFNPVTRRLYGTIRLRHAGGTGLFEGARGETVREFEGQALDPSGLRLLMTGKETGELILP